MNDAQKLDDRYGAVWNETNAGARRQAIDLDRWYREPGKFLYDGHRLIWEYPRDVPDGNQIEITEVMDIADGLIQHHRIYWGWFGIQLLIRSALSKRGEA